VAANGFVINEYCNEPSSDNVEADTTKEEVGSTTTTL